MALHNSLTEVAYILNRGGGQDGVYERVGPAERFGGIRQW
jgi:hypothetical protein